MSARFVFTKIMVRNLDAQAAFYATALGLVVKHRFSGGEGDGAFEEVVLGDDPSLLLLHYPYRVQPPSGGAVLGFAVADLDQAVRAVEAAGGAVLTEPKSIPEAAMRVAKVEDIEGQLLELVQYL
ncbi:VOC family protein [Amycolatopsis sp. YIM 10]|uniref:VOC family protein n=1 Tax=Amycolatopsis sp. YIM 10 TaxID=2653857 RepID=UPI001D14A7BE|nr:VOC family protein [Amycolatopsis sp. YIM 10]